MADRQPETYQRHSQHPGLKVEGRLCRLPRETGRERGGEGETEQFSSPDKFLHEVEPELERMGGGEGEDSLSLMALI